MSITTARGSLLFFERLTLGSRLGFSGQWDFFPPALPWIAGYVLKTPSLQGTYDCLKKKANQPRILENERLLVEMRHCVGGYLIFEAEDSEVINF